MLVARIGVLAMLCFIPTFARAQQPQAPDTEKVALGEQALSQLRELVNVRQQLAAANQRIQQLEAEKAKGDQTK